MTIQTISEAEVMQDVSQILLQHLSPAKVARFWASWQTGRGDYLAWRDEQFGEETVAHLYEAVLEFQQPSKRSPNDE